MHPTTPAAAVVAAGVKAKVAKVEAVLAAVLVVATETGVGVGPTMGPQRTDHVLKAVVVVKATRYVLFLSPSPRQTQLLPSYHCA
jgi:hypothetical protein